MKKTLTMALALLMSSASLLNAQTFSESFEGETFPPAGWTTEVTPSTGVTYFWERIYRENGSNMNGKAFAEIRTADGSEPQKQEWLITPEITIPNDGDYSLQFMWYAQKSGFDSGYCKFEVRVQESGSNEWNKLWDIQNDEDVAGSGVTIPWKQWTVYTSDVKLSTYKGKNIKIAFWYQTTPIEKQPGWFYATGCIDIDAIKIDKLPELTAEVSGPTSYKFENVYIGAKKRGGLTLKNNGRATLKVNSISGLEGTDFSTNLNKDAISLQGGEEASYIVYYTPSLTGAGEATLTIETNGGTLNVKLTGTKAMLPEGYTLESFEEATFPPAGWTNTGWKTTEYIAVSGDKSLTNEILTQCTLTSPRLDLSAGNHKITFDFIEDLVDESGDAIPINDFSLEMKTDDGAWGEIWFAKELKFQEIIRVSLDLNTQSNNCYLRWKYTGDFADPTEATISDIYFDDIVLPPLYKDGVLLPSKNPAPKNETTDCAYTGITLSWESVLFADGYKLYIGTDAENPTSFVNGTSVTKTSYATGTLAPATTYYWKVVPFNATAEATEVPVWSFTTMTDQTIATFPYIMNFDECTTAVPLGWTIAGDGKGWNVNQYSPFEGKNSCSVFINTSTSGEATLQTPLIQLPENRLVAAFWWGKNMPINLKKQTEESQLTGTDKDNDILAFEVKEGNGSWTELAKTFEEEYWAQIILPLNNYAGKQLWFRWRYAAQNGYDADAGGAIDNFYIGEESCLNIHTTTDNQLTVYPTVATEAIYIGGAAPEMQATLYNVAGNAVCKVANTDRIDIASLPEGMYILNISQDNRTYKVRIIKK